MKRRILLFFMVLALVMPQLTTAGVTTPTPEELLRRIDELTRELNKVKQELQQVKAQQEQTSDAVEEVAEKVDESVGGSGSRLELSGDFRFRLDSTRAHVPGYYQYQTDASGNPIAPAYVSAFNANNDTLYTNRLRLNIKARATENIVFKGRLAMYKIWGMETDRAIAAPMFSANGFMWDPNISRKPNDNTLRVEMAYVNWTNIFDLPIWLSIGRRPTVDGPPMQLKYNYEKRYATPIALGVDWTFDGLTLGYAYFDPFPGKIRVCYGRGYESGFGDLYNINPSYKEFDDVDLYGISWDIVNKPEDHLFANIQLFKAGDVPDYMENTNIWGQPTGPNAQLGDIYHASTVFMNRFQGIDWFVSAGLSRTDNRGFNQWGYGLLNSNFEDKNHWGWAAYLGLRVPIEQINSKVGFEYNYGSRYWINFTPASDDLYLSKLATRGHVAEIYWIWDIPENPFSKYGRAFIRAGYQYYWINYTGSGNWVGKPIDIDDLKDPNNTQMFAPIDRMDNFYLTFEVYF